MEVKKQNVIIVGAGTAGLTIASNLQDYFNVTVVEKSKYKSYPLIYGVPLMIGIVIRSKRLNHVTKREIKLSNGRRIPFYEPNLLGGASVMNGCVHVFGFKSKWKNILKKFSLSLDDLEESNKKIFSFDKKEKNKITLNYAPQGCIDNAFIDTLKLRGLPLDDMSYCENEACGYLQNTVRKYFRTSVLSLIKKQKFKLLLDEKVEQLIYEKGRVKGVKTNKRSISGDYVILSSGSIGSCDLMLREKNHISAFDELNIGDNIQDHTNIRVNALATKKINSLNEIYDSWLKKLALGIKHFAGIPTVMRGTGATSAAYLDLDKDGEIDTRIQILQFAETGRHASDGSLFGTNKPSFSFSINAIHPTSLGTISLDGSKNIVDPNFLSTEKDMEILRLALKYCLGLLRSSPLCDYVLKIQDEELIEADPDKFIRDTMYSGHHLIGGLQDAVDSNFKVKNTEGLYVCDASIFDQYVASNIHSSIVLLSDMFAIKFARENYKA